MIYYLSMVFFPLELGETNLYLGFSNGPFIDYGLGDDFVPFHGVFAFEIG
jgi:hypothetical protein